MLPRRSDKGGRKLIEQPDPQLIKKLLETAHYQGSPKHKRNPGAFRLPAYNGIRGDESLCDEHAGFTKENMEDLPRLLERGIKAGLIGDRLTLWTVADSGWIFEGRETNDGLYHGFPVRSSQPIARLVFDRFSAWAAQKGSPADRHAAAVCKALYGFK